MYNAIKYNRPSVIIPHDYDQFDFAVRAKIADIGIPARLKDRNSIESAIREMINRENWKNLEVISKKYREYRPSDILEKEIERLINKNMEK